MAPRLVPAMARLSLFAGAMQIAPTSKRLPLAPIAPPARRRLPLADRARVVDVAARPINAVWELTLRCDQVCSHCSSRAGRARPDELTTAEALEVVEELADLGTLEVTLIGGEAYLRDDWTTIIAAIRRRGMECTMVTGGRGMTAERSRAARDAGVMSVSVSVDGLEATHDALRGRGSFRAAMKAMEHLSIAGVQVSGNTQIGRKNRREIPALFDALADAGAHSWQLQVTVASGRVVDDPQLLLEPYHLLEVMPAIARVRQRAVPRDVRIWPANNLGYHGPHESTLRCELPGKRKGACGAGRAVLGIEANGAIKGCPSLPSAAYVGGNVRDDRLRDIWQRAPSLRFNRDPRRSELWGFCGTCYYADDCLGGCSWTAHSLFGRRGNNPYCHHRALELLGRGRRERVELVEGASGTPFDHGIFRLVEEDFPAPELARAKEVARGEAEWLLE